MKLEENGEAEEGEFPSEWVGCSHESESKVESVGSCGNADSP